MKIVVAVWLKFSFKTEFQEYNSKFQKMRGEMNIYKLLVYGTLVGILLFCFQDWILIMLPIAYIWWCWLPKMANAMGRYTTNQYLRGMAISWVLVGLPVPVLLPLFITNPKLASHLLDIDVVIWLGFGLLNVILCWGEPIGLWDDYEE